MNSKKSAGILPYKKVDNKLFFFLVHPGGPFWARKDLGAWSIPKGEFTSEDELSAAKREFKEETSISLDKVTQSSFIKLSSQTIKSGKTIFAFGLEIDINPKDLKSNTFNIGSREFPEIDRGEWFEKKEALQKINQGQRGFILELTNLLQS